MFQLPGQTAKDCVTNQGFLRTCNFKRKVQQSLVCHRHSPAQQRRTRQQRARIVALQSRDFQYSGEVLDVEAQVDALTNGLTGLSDKKIDGISLNNGSDPDSAKRPWGVLVGDPKWDSDVDSRRNRKRAVSASDGQFLRRKGHLKEQDSLIEFMISLHKTHSPVEVMQKMERWVLEHHKDHKRSQLKRLIPTLGRMHHALPLVDALRTYNEFSHIAQRLYVPPNFAEIRHVLNIAQVRASAGSLKMITFDADGTLYEDGCHFAEDNRMISIIIDLLRAGIHVGIVTAAGYPGDAGKFEQRLAGLLAQFKAQAVPPRLCGRFHVMGGECNYLLRMTEDYRMEFVDDELWRTEALQFSEEDIVKLLDDGERVLKDACTRLRVPVTVIRKEKAVGVVPTVPVIYEVLEEMCLSVQMQVESPIPFCAFNGGGDVFVDVGNKRLGLDALKKFHGIKSSSTIHVGDRFTSTGNDTASRTSASILWVANPEETAFFVNMLLEDVRKHKQTPYIE